MTLVSVLIGLLIDRIAESHRESGINNWFGRAAAAVVRRLPAERNGLGAALLVVLPPALVVLLLQMFLDGGLLGLLGLVFAIAVLVFALGPIDVGDRVEDYVDARRAADKERSDWFYERLTGEAVPENSEREGRRMVEAVLYQAHDQIFATVFWFCVLGPAGAVLYRMAAESALRESAGIAERPELYRSLRHVLGLLGWIPARLMSFGYAITGSFEEALRRMRSGPSHGDDLLAGNRCLLAETGTAALRGDDEIDRAEPDAGGERRSRQPAAVEGARRLALRTGALWLAVLALLTLAGWVT